MTPEPVLPADAVAVSRDCLRTLVAYCNACACLLNEDVEYDIDGALDEAEALLNDGPGFVGQSDPETTNNG